MTWNEEYLMREMAQRCCTTHYRDRIFQGVMLRSARNDYEKIRIRRIIMDAREAWRVRSEIVARKWQSQNARTPLRGRHHDSWAIRESYVRGGSYLDYMDYSNAIRSKAGLHTYGKVAA